MAVNRFKSINDIVNRVAIEVGLDAQTDVFAASDPAFTRLTNLMTSAVQDLMEMFDWQELVREYSYTTGVGETGDLTLPTDFAYMIDQTGWERSSNVPLIGPLSAQDWTYLLGRNLVGSTIYASFRFDQNQLRIFPNDPMPTGLQINFEYISRNLIMISGTTPQEYTDEAQQGADIPFFPPNLLVKYLKTLYLEATGFDSQVARMAFVLAFESWQGKNKGARIVNAGRNRFGFPYLRALYNTPDSGYGV
tara:strand:+ start:1359 stop:2105 length:747 start_codon:yes stop_codon:yes gene_type:complete